MPLIASLVLGAVQSGTGLYQAINASNQAKKNVRPNYNIPYEYYKNLNSAETMASRGLAPQALNTFYNQQGQNQAGAIDAILQSGGDPNAINSVYGNTQQGNQRILAEDANAKDKNLLNVMDINNILAGEKEKQFYVNKFQPYADKAALYSQQKQAGFQNFFGGLDTAGAGFAANQTTKLADAYMRLMNGSSGGSSLAPQTAAPQFNWYDTNLYTGGDGNVTPDNPPDQNYNQLFQ